MKIFLHISVLHGLSLDLENADGNGLGKHRTREGEAEEKEQKRKVENNINLMNAVNNLVKLVGDLTKCWGEIPCSSSVGLD